MGVIAPAISPLTPAPPILDIDQEAQKVGVLDGEGGGDGAGGASRIIIQEWCLQGQVHCLCLRFFLFGAKPARFCSKMLLFFIIFFCGNLIYDFFLSKQGKMLSIFCERFFGSI